jgi:hypothetical protein
MPLFLFEYSITSVPILTYLSNPLLKLHVIIPEGFHAH